jgi:hypothetical protein
MTTTALHPAAAKTLQDWHDMIAEQNLVKVDQLLHPDVVFRSPAAHSPYATAAVTAKILQTVTQVFDDFCYAREFVSSDGLNIVLEFSALVGDKQIKGIDMIRFDTDGKIVEFEVMIRPLSGLQALAEHMGQHLAPYLAQAKIP